MRLKYAGFNCDTERTKAPDEFFVYMAGDFGRRGLNIGWTAAAARISIERKLRNDQRGTAALHERPVHLAGIVRKNPQVGDFLREVKNGFRVIFAAHTKQNQ